MITVVQRSCSSDGTIKYIFKNKVGFHFEAIYLPALPETNVPYSFCISTQAGCAMGCKFCATGLGGFVGDLNSHDIYQQVNLIRLDIISRNIEKPNTNFIIALLGMGEPLLNYEQTIDFCKLIRSNKDYAALKKIVISTIGFTDKILQLSEVAKELKIELYISMHSPYDMDRSKLMPATKDITITDILNTCKVFADKTNTKVKLNYLLLKDVNDSEKHMKDFATIIDPKIFEVRLFLFNATPNMPFVRTDYNKALEFQNILQKYGVKAVIQPSKGRDIDAGCGQFLDKLRLRRNFL